MGWRLNHERPRKTSYSLFENAEKLIIPVYQRNYDWREEHCKKLYQDLVRTIQNKKR